ncbi:TRAP transporter small permease subunit [Zooshikella harenae]|uniref:TRAP transporter small permease protein n=1 Tax=Zooshikella harenae TaxID=2827238 RepID=A0ABS5Z9W6_9GAMM|nr:TRAP transporter small permease subunit [Zooshikella harenae]MBU2710852.1 TRAP transporter small permease subunit [Zooshikella harenae]
MTKDNNHSNNTPPNQPSHNVQSNQILSIIFKATTKIDLLTEHIGRFVSWFSLLLMLSIFLVVLLRYIFNIGSIALQESAHYIHSFIFLTASGYALKHNAHVRVDILYRKMSKKRQALIDALGSLFLLLPVCFFIAIMSWDYVGNSWQVLEGSNEPGGIPGVFLLKSLILAMCFVFILQGFAELFRSILILADAWNYQHKTGVNV